MTSLQDLLFPYDEKIDLTSYESTKPAPVIDRQLLLMEPLIDLDKLDFCQKEEQ